jgi:hypothetical protein
MFRRVVAEEPPPLHDAISKTIATSLPNLEMERNRSNLQPALGRRNAEFSVESPHGADLQWPRNRLAVRYVRHRDQTCRPWPAAEALGWRIAKGPRGKPGWDHRCP